MKQLKDCILKHVFIQPDILDTIVSNFEPKTVSKGSFLLKTGQIANELIFRVAVVRNKV